MGYTNGEIDRIGKCLKNAEVNHKKYELPRGHEHEKRTTGVRLDPESLKSINSAQ